jgi:hypothetical protein
MARIVTTCIVTGKPIDSGIEIDEVSFSLLPPFTGRVFCPYCQTQHEWSRDTALLADDEKAKS